MRKVHGCLSQGSVLGMLAEKTICPKGTFTHRSVCPKGFTGKSACPRGAFQAKVSVPGVS